jgi:hypothetical protein
MGKSLVTMAVIEHRWDASKQAAALVWLELQEEPKHSVAIRLNRHIAIAAYIAAIAAVIGAINPVITAINSLMLWLSK